MPHSPGGEALHDPPHLDRSLAIALVALAVTACAGGPFGAPSPYADVVFYGENIHTVDASTAGASAVAVRGEEIAGVGSREDVAALVGPDTRVVELGERALVPGFIDAHGHFTMVMSMLDLLNASSPPVGPMESIDQIVEALRDRIEEEEVDPGEYVMGYGYDDSLLAENRHPDRDDLDRASTDHPIVLLHVSGHLATANSAALELFGFDSIRAWCVRLSYRRESENDCEGECGELSHRVSSKSFN